VLIHQSKKKKFAFCVAAFLAVFALIEISARLVDSKQQIAANIKIRVRPEVPGRSGPYPNLPVGVEREFELIRHRPFSGKNAGPGIFNDGKLVDLSPGELQDKPTVFFLGGSTVHGAGVRQNQCFAALAQRELSGCRIVNAGRNGFNSHGVSLVAKTIMDHYRPSGLVVMSGNNEWLGWRWDDKTPLADLAKKTMSFSTGFKYLTHGIRRLKHYAASDGKAGPRFNAGHGCLKPKPIAERKAIKWEAVKTNYLNYFCHNLEQIASYAKRKNVPLIFCEVPYRLDLCPAYFIDQPAKAFAAWGAADDYDPTRQRAMLIETLRESRALMSGNLGAMPEINTVIAQVAKRFGVPLVELQEAMESHVVDPANFGRYFMDFCHLTDDGHNFVAGRINRAIDLVLSK
jgi:hypothetical protein